MTWSPDGSNGPTGPSLPGNSYFWRTACQTDAMESEIDSIFFHLLSFAVICGQNALIYDSVGPLCALRGLCVMPFFRPAWSCDPSLAADDNLSSLSSCPSVNLAVPQQRIGMRLRRVVNFVLFDNVRLRFRPSALSFSGGVRIKCFS